MSSQITVLGAGSWGTALAQCFAQAGHNVDLWHRASGVADRIQSTRINEKYFPAHRLDDNIEVVSNWEKSFSVSDIIILAVPTSILPYFLTKICKNIQAHQIILNASKGLDHENLRTISQWIEQKISKDMLRKHYGVLSGPSFALEVMDQKPTGVMLGFHDAKKRAQIKEQLHTARFQIFETDDVVGVEIAGALKNVIAITVGASDVLGFGLNTRAGLLTKGQEEISKIGQALGAKQETFWGLAGMGDLILTCTGDLSRNRRVGKKLAEGKTIRQILKELGQIAEGIRTTKTAFELSKQLELQTPILRETYRAMFKGKPLQEAVETILLEMK